MRKKFKKAVTLLLVCTMMGSLVACSGGSGGNIGAGPGGSVEKVDKNRTQLYVNNFIGGYGSDWLYAAKARYEKLHENDVYEEGKQGIQIMVNDVKENASTQEGVILNNFDEIYFTEGNSYLTLQNKGIFLDITQALTGDLSAYGDVAGSTVEGKLTEEQKAYYGISESDGKVHYYGIPHYASSFNFTYNVDRFNQMGYYFIDNPTNPQVLEDYFIYSDSDKKSAGPDGQYNTDDDGLPATYDEFFKLCEYMRTAGDDPIVFSGYAYRDYLSGILWSLAADYEGKDQYMLNYTQGQGEVKQATNLARIVDGSLVKDATPTQITKSNLSELSRQAGKYYALSFLKKLMSNESYTHRLSYNTAFSHLDAQDEFLYAGQDGTTAPIGMLYDGIWWQSEADYTFTTMKDSMGQDYAKENRNFAVMPWPKADSSKIGEKNVLFDHLASYSFVKSNIAEWKKPIAIDFLMFCNTNESLVEYTQITNTPKALNYTLTEADLAKMSPYGRSVIKMRQNSDIIYPYSSTEIYRNNISSFSNLFSSIPEKEYTHAVNALKGDKTLTAIDYFDGMKKYYDLYWKSMME